MCFKCLKELYFKWRGHELDHINL